MEAAREMRYLPECPSPPRISIQVPIIDPGVPRTPEVIAQKLRERYNAVCESKEKHEKQLQKTQDEIRHIQKEMEELRVKAPAAAERFRYNFSIFCRCFIVPSFFFLLCYWEFKSQY